MAITFGKDKTKKEIAKALTARYGSTMNGAKPGHKPPPSSKLKVNKNGIKIIAKF